MTRTRVTVAAVAATAALALAPLASAHAAEPDPTLEARASLLAAAVFTQTVAEDGYHATITSDFGGGDSAFDMRVEAWTRYDGTAAVRSEITGYGASTTFTGTTLDLTANTPKLKAWTRISPRGKADARVLRQLPADARYATGPASANTMWNQNGWGFTADQVNQNLSRGGFLPWNIATLIAMCGESDPSLTVTCDGTVETVSGRQKMWRFNVVQTFDDGTPYPIDVTVKSDTAGLITRVEYGQGPGPHTVTSARLNTDTIVPTPALRPGHTIASRSLTEAAAVSDVKTVARNFRNDVTDYLASAGRPVTARNVQWAYERLTREGGVPFFRGQSQWSGGMSFTGGLGTYIFSSTGSDGITSADSYATVTVHHGEMHTAFTREMPVMTAITTVQRSAAVGLRTPRPTPWSAPAR